MNGNQKLIAVILVLALGTTFELFKRVSFDQNNNGQMNSLLSSFDFTPFAKTHNDSSVAQKNRFGKAGSRRSQREEPLRALQQLADNTAKKTAAEESADLAPKTKAEKDKDKKKKKKKRKKTDIEGEDTTEVADTDDEDLSPEDQESDDTGPGDQDSGVAGGFNNSLIPQTNEATPVAQVIEQWASELLKSPDYRLLNEFISLKQTGAIPDEVFYAVIQMMLDDSREDIQVMGVEALGATPSQNSFEKLVDVRQKAIFGSRVAQNVSQHINGYSNLNQVSALRNVFYSSDNLEAIRVAAQLVDQAASRYLVAGSSGDVGSQDQAVRPSTSSIDIFKGFTVILRSLVESSTDQQIVSAATQALSRIEQNLPAPTETPDDSLVTTI